jgi:hypothetical protein
MMYLRHFVFLLLLLPGGARRSVRNDGSHHGAQRQRNMLTNGLEVSAESREALIPRTGLLRRAGQRLPKPWSQSGPRRSREVVAILRDYSVGPQPLANLAVAAIDSNERRNQGAVMAVSDEVVSELANVDKETKEKLLKVLDEVDDNARQGLLAGITDPMGFFDPVGFATQDTVSAGKLLFYREVELKHGRVAMLASLGILVGEQFHPLFGGNIDVPSYVAFQATPLQTFWPAVVAAIAIPEIYSVFSFQSPAGNEPWSMRTDRRPGDFGFDPLGIRPEDPKELNEMQTKELNNGRLAMIATAGMIAQEIASGQKLF